MFTVTHGDSRSKLYYVWRQMKARCSSPGNKDYKRYGFYGIKVCDEWLDYRIFRQWANDNGYAEGLTIDRIQNDGNYEPNNCRFATRSEQQHNLKSRLNDGVGIKEIKPGKFRVQIYNGGKIKHLGTFNNLEDAQSARKAGEIKYWI